MDEVLHRFDRRWFQVWRYTAGHSTLLLRSVIGDAADLNTLAHAPPLGYHHPTRIDVVFKGVQALILQNTEFHQHLLVSCVTDSEAMLAPFGMTMAAFRAETVLFAVNSGQGRSLVAATTVAVAEDDRAFFEPSAFDGSE